MLCDAGKRTINGKETNSSATSYNHSFTTASYRLDHSPRGMPQGSWLGPLIFTIFIDNFQLGPLVHKYVDDTNINTKESRHSEWDQ